MRKLTCELCGSADIIKKDGVFVCENCGTKYTFEEAKKMLVDGIVNVQGVVQIDDSNRLNNYLVQANIAFEAGENDKATEYCDKILDNDSNFEQAWILKGKICFRNKYRSSITYYKKASEIAAKKGVDIHKALLKQINNNICEYFENVCDQYNLLGFIDLTKNHIKIVNDYGKIDKQLFLDVERIKTRFEIFIKEQFNLNNFFVIREEYTLFGDNYDYWEDELYYFLEKMIKFNLITNEGYEHIAKNISDFATAAVYKSYDVFCSAKYTNRGKIYENDANKFKSVVIGTLDLIYLFHNKTEATFFTAGYNVLKEIYPRLLEISWEEGRDSYSYTADFKNGVETKIHEIGSKIKPIINTEDVLYEENTKTSEETQDCSLSIMCEKCQKEFSYKKGKEIYDDEKEGVICPECGHINLKKDIPEIKNEEDKCSVKTKKTNRLIDLLKKMSRLILASMFLSYILFVIDAGIIVRRVVEICFVAIFCIRLVTETIAIYTSTKLNDITLIKMRREKYAKGIRIFVKIIGVSVTLVGLGMAITTRENLLEIILFMLCSYFVFMCIFELILSSNEKILIRLNGNMTKCKHCNNDFLVDEHIEFLYDKPIASCICPNCNKGISIHELEVISKEQDDKKVQIVESVNSSAVKNTQIQTSSSMASVLFLFTFLILNILFFMVYHNKFNNCTKEIWYVAILEIIVTAIFTFYKYKKEANIAREKYLSMHTTEFRKYALDEKSAKELLNIAKDSDAGNIIGFLLSSSFALAVILFIIYFIFFVLYDIENPKIVGYYVLTWGFLSSLATLGLIVDVEKTITGQLEKYRCPHCDAPLSYHHTKTYTDNERYFQKRVKKYDSELKMYITETQNWCKYDEHHIYTCIYCEKRDDKVREREERVDKMENVLDVLKEFSSSSSVITK